MDTLKFGDIVLLKFPFTYGKPTKNDQLYSLIIFDDGDLVVCRITCKLYETRFNFP